MLLLKPRFDYRPDSPLQYPGIGLTREAEECNRHIVGSHPLVTLLMKVMKESNPGSPHSAFTRECVTAGLIEILKVLLPPPDNVPSRGQQPPTPTVNSVGEALLPPPEAPDSLPESLQGQPAVLLHGLTELFPGGVFTSATGWAAACLASRYPSAASGVPQANHSR
ncbi:hypothetical protein AMECASPLE_025876 [Ameca splendens]|uniref:Uncharacterized protein n=1 Tax=Ameca splendens TaxID=208324 RepID=A0ABV0YRR5_9TELE